RAGTGAAGGRSAAPTIGQGEGRLAALNNSQVRGAKGSSIYPANPLKIRPHRRARGAEKNVAVVTIRGFHFQIVWWREQAFTPSRVPRLLDHDYMEDDPRPPSPLVRPCFLGRRGPSVSTADRRRRSAAGRVLPRVCHLAPPAPAPGDARKGRRPDRPGPKKCPTRGGLDGPRAFQGCGSWVNECHRITSGVGSDRRCWLISSRRPRPGAITSLPEGR